MMVQPGTVSNVLNRPALVSEPIRARDLDAIEELVFVRDVSARQLTSGPQQDSRLRGPRNRDGRHPEGR